MIVSVTLLLQYFYSDRLKRNASATQDSVVMEISNINFAGAMPGFTFRCPVSIGRQLVTLHVYRPW